MKKYLIIISLCAVACKAEDPVPADVFAGDYLLLDVLEEFDPPTGTQFLAPEVFQVTKTEFLDPVSGTRVNAYKYEDDTRFIGMTSSNSEVLIGTDGCPNVSDLDAVSLTASADSTFRLNLRSCEGREVLADYTKR